MTLRSWFRKEKKDLFLPVERVVLAAMEAALPDELRATFPAQVAGVTLVQRHGDGREVNLYRYSGRTLIFPPNWLPTQDEIAFARVTLRIGDAKKKVAATVWVVNGHLFQIAFNAPVSKMPGEPKAEKVEILWDKPTVTADQTPLLDRLRQKWEVKGTRPPLPSEEREQAIGSIPAKLPSDYLSLAQETDGFAVGICTVLGLEAVRPIPPEETAYLLAEIQDGAAPGGIAAAGGRLFRVRFEDLSLRPLEHRAFIPAIEEVLEDLKRPTS